MIICKNRRKKPRKPRTKKVDMIKKKAELAKLKETMPPKKEDVNQKVGKLRKI